MGVLAFGGLGAAAFGQQFSNLKYTNPYAITTLAGQQYFSGYTDATGTNAQFNLPYGIVLDSSGNAYVADENNLAVRKITPAGVVSTFADSTVFGPITGIAIDNAGNFYVCDLVNSSGTSGAIRKLAPSSVLSTLVPPGVLNHPTAIAVDTSGNVYVADAGNNVIRKVTPAGTVSILAGIVGKSAPYTDGPGTGAVFGFVGGMTIDPSGNLYVTDSSYDVVRKITPAGVVSLVAGQVDTVAEVDGAPGSAAFAGPTGIACDSAGNLYVIDGATDSAAFIRQITPSGAVSTLAGSNQGLTGNSDATGSFASFNGALGIAVDASSNIYVTNSGNNTVRKGVPVSATQPPTITSQPTGANGVLVGATVNLGVIASGVGLTYQWNLNTAAVPGATGSTYAAMPTQVGTYNYTVTVANANGSVTSNVAAVVVPPPSGPSITTQPSSQTVTAGSSVSFSVAATGGTNDMFQWYFDGSQISGATGSTYTLSNAQALNAGSYTVNVTSNGASTPSNVATLTVNPGQAGPTITTQPTPQAVTAGGTANLVVVASGTGDTYQWKLNGTAIAGATNAAYTVTNAQSGSGGTYTVTITSGGGSVTSNGAALTVNPAGSSALPAISVQPSSQTIVTGTTVVFNTTATGTSTPTYQWQLNGTAVTGATSARYVIAGAAAANAGTYACLVSTPAGGTTATVPATLSLTSTTNVGRLINLSVNTTAGPKPSGILTVGFTVGGSASGTQNLLIRADGPALGALGVPGTLADPALSVFLGQTVVASNDNWGTPSSNVALVNAADTATFAFPFNNSASLDAALVTPLASGTYTAQVSGNTAASGTVLAELYDDTPAGTYTLATPRLINLSANNQVAAKGSLTAGFSVGGTTSKTVLIRADGPALATLGVPGTMPDPQLALHTTINGADTVLATNAGWGGDPQITAVDNSVFAFALNSGSADSVVLVTLPPGVYTAVASSVSGVAGVVLVEVYEVP